MEATCGGFEAVVSAFSKQIAELREATLLRVDDTTRQLHTQDVEAIEATVRALEHKLRDIKAYVAREAAAIPQVEAVVAACQLQQHHLHHIAGHLPTYLPSLRSPEVAGVKENSRAAPNQAAAADGGGGGGPKKRPPAPRRYITADELASVSSYMRGRLTADRINAALDEMAALAEGNAAMVAAARRNRATGPNKKHAMWIAFNVAPHEPLKGRSWVLEADLRTGTAVRLDKTGKALLTLLRHLGRLQEVRVQADGATHLVYVMLPGAGDQ
ncbi:hypothetical protein CHLNCDRAFT_143235 [Chlorella variabilis]|uniref:Spindle and kinetochore-associated protein 1 n=1 Tax=Chlorella variabilis TaxID=554065 RepID=E1Z9S5_CHLVA|nr:hypothetical protein CHLNCDRAFT_143235 [Chlorella variabilis]EFN57576.1 hypothetical protein CHLNCDRAFT_143235 [Chlorella variabilis]|eukprot:XP_005849678.1 hypothetical protein CHLNCDRAFT_143235 [Chlorella variabilis]